MAAATERTRNDSACLCCALRKKVRKGLAPNLRCRSPRYEHCIEVRTPRRSGFPSRRRAARHHHLPRVVLRGPRASARAIRRASAAALPSSPRALALSAGTNARVATGRQVGPRAAGDLRRLPQSRGDPSPPRASAALLSAVEFLAPRHEVSLVLSPSRPAGGALLSATLEARCILRVAAGKAWRGGGEMPTLPF